MDALPRKQLYAIAVEIPTKINGELTWIPEITHVHAEHSGEARYIYMQDTAHHKHRIVAIGPVIGYFVHDEHGEVLSA